MASNSSRGAYYKARTKRWLAAHGFQVLDLEIVHWVHLSAGRRIPVKRDQMGADLLAVSGRGLAFIQVKGGAQAVGHGQFLAAQREFAKWTVPPWVRQIVVAWAPGARTPRLITCVQRETTR